MEYEKIKQLMEDMGNSKLSAIDIDFPDGTKVSMKKEITQVVTSLNEMEINKSNTSNNEINEGTSKIKKSEEKDEELSIIKSPMVGTFYSKPSPTSDPFCEVRKRNKKRANCMYY